MIVMMMAPRADDVREYLSDTLLRAPGSVMWQLDNRRSENDQGGDLVAMMIEEGDGDQQQDMGGTDRSNQVRCLSHMQGMID